MGQVVGLTRRKVGRPKSKKSDEERDAARWQRRKATLAMFARTKEEVT